MGAGSSARFKAAQSRALADQYEALRQEALFEAQSYAAGAAGESATAALLEGLTALGWRVLPDRRWGRRSNVDFLLVGPGGVVVVDAKLWRDVRIEDGRLMRDQEDCESEIEKNLGLRDQVAAALAPAGLAPSAVHVALVFSRRRMRTCLRGVHLLGDGDVASWLTLLPRRLDAAAVTQVADALDEAFPPIRAPREMRVRAVRRRAVMPRVEAAAEPSLFDVDELTDALLQAKLTAPIEEWMTFLHPAQLRLVSASYRGPARVRGPAGTGKTVVGLHRAAHLARRSRDPIFFVTYVRTLPVVLRSLATRLDPISAEQIEFSGLHRLARRVLDLAGVEVRVDQSRVETAFSRAWVQVGRDSVLATLDERPSYWKEEIDCVIKGRGIDDFEDYADLSRTGRRTPMSRAHREVMWDLYVAYSRLLEHSGSCDFNDVLIRALDLVRAGDSDLACGGVIVDEVQDLTMVGLQLLHALAGDGPDRFLIIGDGQQSIYPGGFTLAEAGIDVRGRATVLEVNYRNTAEILDAAGRVIGTDAFDDLEGVTEDGHRRVEVRRRGEEPTVHRACDPAAMDLAVLAQVSALHHAGIRLGDVALLCLRSNDAGHYAGVLRRGGVDVVDLLDYDGVTSDRVKVGTVKRAKGLEFAHVLLPDLTEAEPPPWPGEGPGAYEERQQRHRREVFVAMTRARDGLWLGYLPG